MKYRIDAKRRAKDRKNGPFTVTARKTGPIGHSGGIVVTTSVDIMVVVIDGGRIASINPSGDTRFNQIDIRLPYEHNRIAA